MTSSTKRWVGLGLAVLILGVLALPKIVQLTATSAPTAPPPGAFAALVTVEAVAPRPFQATYATTGTLRADEAVQLRSETAGRVVAVHFREGMAVAPGDLLVEMFDDDLQARRARVAAQLALAERELRRQEALLAEGGTTEQVFDQVGSERAVLRAELREIDADLVRTQIRAPFAGVVGLRAVSPGAYITPGTDIAMLQALNPMKRELAVPERLGPQVRVGTAVSFTVQGQPAPYTGTVYASEPGVDETTRTVRFRARVPNPDGALRPGAFARVEVALGETQPDALLVPSVALVANGAQQTVYVYRDGKAEPRAVQTGARTSDRVQVLSGLRPGDAVVVSGVQNVRPGLDLTIDTSATAFRPEDVQLEGASAMEETGAPAPDPAPTP